MIKREEYMIRIRPFIGNELIKVLVDIRRSGKSVMLELIQNELIENDIDETVGSINGLAKAAGITDGSQVYISPGNYDINYKISFYAHSWKKQWNLDNHFALPPPHTQKYISLISKRSVTGVKNNYDCPTGYIPRTLLEYKFDMENKNYQVAMIYLTSIRKVKKLNIIK